MPIKNYSSGVEAIQSLAEIQVALAKGGATKIMTDYENGKPVGITFAINTSTGIHGFALPANVEGVAEAFRRQRVKVDRAQAERTAWRNIRDWVLAQMAFIESGAVQMDEVFLPYLSNGQKTLYQAYQDGQLLLPEG